MRGEDGRAIAVAYDYIEARPLGALARAPPSPPARDRLAGEVGAALTALHAVPVEEARAIGVPERDLGEELYAPMVEACLPHLGPRGRAWIEGRFAEFIDGGGSRGAPRTLVHGDLDASHLLADADGRLAAVIDWADALIADPAYDLAGLLAGCPPAFAERAIASYDGPAEPRPRHAPPRRLLRRCAAAVAGPLRRRHRRRRRAPPRHPPHRRPRRACGGAGEVAPP